MINYRQNDQQDFVQAFITAIGFPDTINNVRTMGRKNRIEDEWFTDLDILLQSDEDTTVSWTSPRWTTTGDIVFFYHTKTARSRIIALYKQAVEKYHHDEDLINLLEHALHTANLYSGTILGCAEVTGATFYEKASGLHFNSRFFAPLSKIHIFGSPLLAKVFADFIKIGQSTITPLYGQQFEGIKSKLLQTNELPDYLAHAKFGELSFRNVNQSNWPEVCCAGSTRFIHESQLRAYLLDYLLNEVKDTGTPLLEECQCYRNNIITGIVDYFICIHGKWVPVEAKLNILTENNLLSQVEKYSRVDTFVPTKGNQRGRVFECAQTALCLVADQSGIYSVLNRSFFKCSPGKPVWQRQQLTHSIANDIRRWLQNIV